MRFTLALPMILLAACQADVDQDNGAVNLQYDQELAENTVETVGNHAEVIGEQIANDVQDAGAAVANTAERAGSAAQNVDVDVDVDANTADGRN